jgi:ATP-dependent DNA ligase
VNRRSRKALTGELDEQISHLTFEPPMLARLVRTLPEGPQWEYEVKLDGYRLEAIKQGEKVRLYSRRGSDFTRKFASIATKVSRIKESSFVLDGEAVAVDEKGCPRFKCSKIAVHCLPVGRSVITPSTCCT